MELDKQFKEKEGSRANSLLDPLSEHLFEKVNSNFDKIFEYLYE